MTTPFELGQPTATAGVAEKMNEDQKFYDFVYLSLKRYMTCDWGDMSDSDKAQNDEAVESGLDRIFAAYNRPGKDETIWIITEADRSVTTILFPDEY